MSTDKTLREQDVSRELLENIIKGKTIPTIIYLWLTAFNNLSKICNYNF